MRPLKLMAQVSMSVMSHKPFTVCVSNFWDEPVHLPKDTLLSIALPSPAHNMSSGPAFPGVPAGEKRVENESGGSLSTDSAKA